MAKKSSKKSAKKTATKARAPFFEVYKTEDVSFAAPWRWRLKAGNGEIIASGESYFNKADALHCVDLIQGTGNADVREIE